MPKPKQMTPQQIAQYYASAYTDLNPAQYTRVFSNFINTVKDEIELADENSPLRSQLNNLLQILTNLDNEAKAAGQAQKNKNAAEADQHRNNAAQYAAQINGAAGEALKQAYIQHAVDNMDPEDAEDQDQVETTRRNAEKTFGDVFTDTLKAINDEAQVKTANEWIEDAQADFNDPNYSRDRQIARIIAARQIARNRSAGQQDTEDTEITADEIDRYAAVLMGTDGFDHFLEAYKNSYDAEDLTDGDGQKLEEKLDLWVKAQPEEEYEELDNALFGRYKFEEEDVYKEYQETLPKDKTAAEIIEDVQRKIRYQRDSYTDRDLAVILAARQLANARRGHRENLDNTRITQEELNKRADDLLKDSTFQEYLDSRREELGTSMYRARKRKAMRSSRFKAYMRENEIGDPDVAWNAYVQEHKKDPARVKRDEARQFIAPGKLLSGHSGTLEDNFEAFLKKKKNLKDLDPAIYGRYQRKYVKGMARQASEGRKASFKYDDYFKNNINGKTVSLRKGAELAAANKLARKHPNSQFDKALFDRTVEEMLNDPAFRFVMRDKSARDMLNSGDTEAFAGKVQEVRDAFAGMIEKNDDEGTYFSTTNKFTRAYNKLNPAPPEAEVEQIQHKLMPGECRRLKQEFAENLEKDAKTMAMNTLRDEYEQKYHTLDSFAADFKEDLEMHFRYESLVEENKQYLINREKAEYNKKVAEQARNQAVIELAKKSGRSIDEIEEDPRYRNLITKNTETEKRKILKEHAKLGIGPGVDQGRLSMSTRAKAVELATQNQLSKRGPKFRNMISAVNELKAKKVDEVRESDLIKTVNSILEYQDGKEKGFSNQSKNQRFDDSMRLLAELTVGTPAEKYYRAQLEKVNAARGLSPDSPGYLKPETFLESQQDAYVETDEELAARRSLFEKINKFTFLQGSEAENSMEDDDMMYGSGNGDIRKSEPDEAEEEQEEEREEEIKEIQKKEEKKKDPDDEPEMLFI